MHFAYHVTHLADFSVAQALEQTAGMTGYLLLLLVTALLIGRPDRESSRP